ncbi:hypothetical protein, partial [Enterococcus casseliflavus]|uniref:hypothetical protein n=1 Tax=Enterococcus casseliflavus TaxID=37734 RepID=UPI003D0DCDE9
TCSEGRATDKAPCPAREFVEVPVSRVPAAERRLGNEAWRVIGLSEAADLVDHEFTGWGQITLVKAASGNTQPSKLAVVECEDGLRVTNLDLCPDG